MKILVGIKRVVDFNVRIQVKKDGMDYLVMECVPGQTLSQKMRSQQLPTKEILTLGVQVAGALEEAHEQGVVHRDLKPSNIMVTRPRAKPRFWISDQRSFWNRLALPKLRCP